VRPAVERAEVVKDQRLVEAAFARDRARRRPGEAVLFQHLERGVDDLPPLGFAASCILLNHLI
jgi:hypothetical protein